MSDINTAAIIKFIAIETRGKRPYLAEFEGWDQFHRENALYTVDDVYKMLEKVIKLNGKIPDYEQKHHGLDDDTRVCFYEHDFYVLSNFSSFNLMWHGITFPTSEHAYHWEKFNFNYGVAKEANLDYGLIMNVRDLIVKAKSAHVAFQLGQQYKHLRHPSWDDIKIPQMKKILHQKVEQHEYVKYKLEQTGDRLLIEDSWRDGFWGINKNWDGLNMLGKIWMEIRSELFPK